MKLIAGVKISRKPNGKYNMEVVGDGMNEATRFDIAALLTLAAMELADSVDGIEYVDVVEVAMRAKVDQVIAEYDA